MRIAPHPWRNAPCIARIVFPEAGARVLYRRDPGRHRHHRHPGAGRGAVVRQDLPAQRGQERRRRVRHHARRRPDACRQAEPSGAGRHHARDRLARRSISSRRSRSVPTPIKVSETRISARVDFPPTIPPPYPMQYATNPTVVTFGPDGRVTGRRRRSRSAASSGRVSRTICPSRCRPTGRSRSSSPIRPRLKCGGPNGTEPFPSARQAARSRPDARRDADRRGSPRHRASRDRAALHHERSHRTTAPTSTRASTTWRAIGSNSS